MQLECRVVQPVLDHLQNLHLNEENNYEADLHANVKEMNVLMREK